MQGNDIFWRLNIFLKGFKLEGYHLCLDASASAEKL